MGLPGQLHRGRSVRVGSTARTRRRLHRGRAAPDGRHCRRLGTPSVDAEAAVLFTSGATGPAKGVVYRHRQLEAQRDAVARPCSGSAPSDRLVAAFAPFALYGPALGIASAVPDMDVTEPGTLTATALAEAVAAIDATVVFAAPAALRNVVARPTSSTRRSVHDADPGAAALVGRSARAARHAAALRPPSSATARRTRRTG